jgi:PKD repeat protein
MKNNLILVCLTAFIALISCEKDNKNNNNTNTSFDAHACFYLRNTELYVDSTMEVINCSDTLNVSYLWQFGDGESSTERQPNHIYRNFGSYTASLVTFVDNKPTDTAYKVINIKIGEKYYDFMARTEGYDLAECPDSSILVFGHSFNEWDFDNELRFMIKFDKNLNIKWKKSFTPWSNSVIHNITPTSDGNFIVSSSKRNTYNCYYTITKIDTGGNIIFNKSLSEIQGVCSYAAETADKGFILIGEENKIINTNDTIPFTTIAKTDASGNFSWKKNYSDRYCLMSKNVIQMNDGYLFGTNYKGLGETDSLIIIKLDLQGNLVWQTSKEWQIPDSHIIYNIFNTTLIQTDNYIIAINDGHDMILFFTPEGQFVKRVSTGLYRNELINKTSNNQFFIYGGDTYWENIQLIGYNASGTESWSKGYGKRNCNYGYLTNAKVVNGGNYICIGTSFKECSPETNSLILFRINEKGELQ